MLNVYGRARRSCASGRPVLGSMLFLSVFAHNKPSSNLDTAVTFAPHYSRDVMPALLSSAFALRLSAGGEHLARVRPQAAPPPRPCSQTNTSHTSSISTSTTSDRLPACRLSAKSQAMEALDLVVYARGAAGHATHTDLPRHDFSLAPTLVR